MKPAIRTDAEQIGYARGYRQAILDHANETMLNDWREAGKEVGRKVGVVGEQKRIIDLLIELDAIRRCATTGSLVAFNTDGTKVIYLTGLEGEAND
jgi:hypothetical protein